MYAPENRKGPATSGGAKPKEGLGLIKDRYIVRDT